MIELRDVTLTYPDGDGVITAVNAASLTVMPGEITAITGPSGSGKSSVLAVASTLISPQQGSVLINGTAAAGLSRSETAALRRDEIGIVFQQTNLLASLTALEQLELMGHLGSSATKRSRAETRTKALGLLAAVGLEKKAHKRPHALSGGERQRVNIARAFMNDPSVLVVDEPTSALDQERGAAIIELIIELTRTRNVATLLVTHDRTHLPQMDSVLLMVDGDLSVHAAAAEAA
jgi:putative ABC transport system ATP-binding protein